MPRMTAADLLVHNDNAALWPGVSGYEDAVSAYEAALAVRSLRIARGELPVGFKIGFTNRGMWERYGVFAPIWGSVWNTTLTFSRDRDRNEVKLAGTSQPRIEPEIVFGMCATPPNGATLEQIFACVDWLAPGFEIVQSHSAEWKFTAFDTIADNALHARLLIGSKRQVRQLAKTGSALNEFLAQTRVNLFRDGIQVENGIGAQVLDGPLNALRYFVSEIQGCPGAPILKPGDVVTTGTWTDAWPVAIGQTWLAEFDPIIGSVSLVSA